MKSFLEPYNPNWKTGFEDIRQVLAAALGEFGGQIDIQHVGSTSVEGLVAKPILDIDIIIENISLLPEISAKLLHIGYISRGDQGVPGRFAFRQQSDFTPLSVPGEKKLPHHLYVCLAGSLALKNHILFRDALRNDPALLQRYAELKLHLTTELKLSREAYAVKKTGFIVSVLAGYGLAKRELEEIANANT